MHEQVHGAPQAIGEQVGRGKVQRAEQTLASASDRLVQESSAQIVGLSKPEEEARLFRDKALSSWQVAAGVTRIVNIERVR